MKTFKLFSAVKLMLLAVVILLPACSQDEDLYSGDDRTPVSFVTQITVDNVSRTRTTAQGNQWLADDSIGIYMIAAGGTISSSLAANSEYHAVTGNSSTSNFEPANDNATIYYPQSGNVDFVAYYPYSESITNFSYPVNVSLQSNPAAIDLLYSNNVKNKAKSQTEPATLQFTHRLSKLILNVVKGNGMAAADFSSATASIAGMPATAQFALSDATLSGKTLSTAFAALKVATETGSDASFEAILIPQAAGEFANRKVTFNIGGELYVWSIPDNAVFEQGKQHIYTITVNETATSGAGTINPWDDGAPSQSGEASAAGATLLLDGLATGTTIKVNFTDGTNNSYALPTDGTISFVAPYVTKTIRSIQLNGGSPVLVGRKASERIRLKFFGGNLVFRDTNSAGNIPIGSYAEFQLINTDATTLDGHYELEADLDLLEEEWTPVGKPSASFTGVFDGNGFGLSRLKITGNNNYVGLFGIIDGEISNVSITSGSIVANSFVGSICGLSSQNGIIKFCQNEATLQFAEGGGGICGASGGLITNCSNKGSIAGTAAVGGICGANSGDVIDSSNFGIVTCTNGAGASQAGGICGGSSSTISGCYNAAAVAPLPGVCGYNNKGTIENCYNTASAGVGICRTNTNGGMIKHCYNTAGNVKAGICEINDSRIWNCYNKGNITSTSAAGICSSNNSGMIIACYNSGNFSGGSSFGIVTRSSGVVIACYNTGSLSGSGICGVNGEYMGSIGGVPTAKVGYIVACYNTGTVSGAAICGENLVYSHITDCYWANATTDIAGGAGTSANVYAFGNGTANTGWPTGADISLTWPNGMSQSRKDMIINGWKLQTNAGYWKTLGSWNNGNPVYPKLYWED
ncbi:fimbrillin family protein [Viscerimonas tarda]